MTPVPVPPHVTDVDALRRKARATMLVLTIGADEYEAQPMPWLAYRRWRRRRQSRSRFIRYVAMWRFLRSMLPAAAVRRLMAMPAERRGYVLAELLQHNHAEAL